MRAPRPGGTRVEAPFCYAVRRRPVAIATMLTISAMPPTISAVTARPLLDSFFTTATLGEVELDALPDDDELCGDSAAAVSLSTGAGRSGSGWPSTVSWIHDTS